ncbi:iron dicitrate transporter FecR [Spirochaetia bacterium]|nr:iron dicitrate transporter FecR [Spirochaetia bacterium]
MKKLLVCCFLLVICGGSVFAQDMTAVFLEVSGTVEIKEDGAAGWKTASPGVSAGKNTIVSTGLKSSAVLSLGSSRIEIRPLTMLTLEELTRQSGAEEASLYLRTGRVRAEVRPPTGTRVDFSVKSPSATASVRGTSFEFDGVRLWVNDGRVLLAGANGQRGYVNGGQRSYVDESNGRIVPPFEVETALLSPSIPELTSTGQGNAAPPGITAPVIPDSPSSTGIIITINP